MTAHANRFPTECAWQRVVRTRETTPFAIPMNARFLAGFLRFVRFIIQCVCQFLCRGNHWTAMIRIGWPHLFYCSLTQLLDQAGPIDFTTHVAAKVIGHRHAPGNSVDRRPRFNFPRIFHQAEDVKVNREIVPVFIDISIHAGAVGIQDRRSCRCGGRVAMGDLLDKMEPRTVAEAAERCGVSAELLSQIAKALAQSSKTARKTSGVHQSAAAVYRHRYLCRQNP